jgi:hypothetical protein
MMRRSNDRGNMLRRSAALVIAAMACPMLTLAPRASADEPKRFPNPFAEAFPWAWDGHWKGDAELVRAGAANIAFKMELIVKPTDDMSRWTWTIVYDGAAGRQERAYELVVKDDATGSFQIDEKNGIVLEARLLGGMLYSTFEVQGTRLHTSYRMEDVGTDRARLTVEITTWQAAAAQETGGGDAPAVQTWAVSSLQRATLRRVAE